jgi:hypothetical protein
VIRAHNSVHSSNTPLSEEGTRSRMQTNSRSGGGTRWKNTSRTVGRKPIVHAEIRCALEPRAVHIQAGGLEWNNRQTLVEFPYRSCGRRRTTAIHRHLPSWPRPHALIDDRIEGMHRSFHDGCCFRIGMDPIWRGDVLGSPQRAVPIVEVANNAMRCKTMASF